MTLFKPTGIYAAMLTPFAADGGINDSELRRMTEFMIQKGLHGLFPTSSVGEFVHMAPDQICRCMEIVVDQAAGRVPVTPGVSATCAANAIYLAKYAQALGCPAVVVCPPYYYPISQASLAAHVTAIADAVDIPLILYNIPLFATPFSYELVAQLAKSGRIAAMKDSSGSMVDLMHFMDVAPDVNFLVGREEMLAAALAVGAKGCMTATSGIVPEVMLGIWHAFHEGDWAKMNRLQKAILPLLRACFAGPFPAGFKKAMAARGFVMGPLKRPLAAEEEKLLDQLNIVGLVNDLLQQVA